MKRISSIFLFIIVSINLFAQQGIQLNGTVIDKDTKATLPYSHVLILNKNLGAITDINGVFSFSYNSLNTTDTVQVQFVGYEPFTCDVASFLKKDDGLIELVKKDLIIKEVVISAKPIRLDKFMKQTVKTYWKNRRSDPHIALAHYSEKAKFNNKYVMFSESIGYAIYTGDKSRIRDVESYYAFFCDNTRKSDRKKEWLNLARIGADGEKMSDIYCLSNRCYRNIEYLEGFGPLSKKEWKNYSFTIDSSYFENDRKVYVVGFEKKSTKGKLTLFVDNQELKIIQFSHSGYGLSPLKNRIIETSEIRFSYYRKQAFIKSIRNYHREGELEFWNESNTMLQKFDGFSLDKLGIWSLMIYQGLPFVEYQPDSWKEMGVTEDPDMAIIEQELKTRSHNLEEQFVKNSGTWWIKDYKKSMPAVSLEGIEDYLEAAPKFVKGLMRFF